MDRYSALTMTQEERNAHMRAETAWQEKEKARWQEGRERLAALIPEKGITPKKFHEEALRIGVRADVSHGLLFEMQNLGILEIDRSFKLLRGHYWPDGYQGKDDPR